MDTPLDKQPTPLSELGEFNLIKRLTENLTSKNKNVLKGIGDDAAVIKTGKGDVLLVTSDMLCEGVHFNLLYTPVKHLGYKSVVVNISDIYAMNGIPQQITVSLGVSNKISVEFLEELYKGMKLACEHYNVEIVGGDTVSSQSGLIISISALGTAKEKEVVYRSTAGENDLICVSGDLGAAYMGLQLLEREKSVFESSKSVQPDLSGNDYILERQLKPEARRDVIEALKAADIQPTSMIDISDGISSDILHITDTSGVGASIYEEKIPIDPATAMMADQFNVGPVTAALNGGEDYELLFTLDLKDHDKISAIPGISIIGHMTGKNEKCNLITISNEVVPIRAAGWQAFKED